MVGDGIQDYGCPPDGPPVAGPCVHGAQPGRRKSGDVRRGAGRAGGHGPSRSAARRTRKRRWQSRRPARPGEGSVPFALARRRIYGSESVCRPGDHRPPRRGHLRRSTVRRSGSATARSPTSSPSWAGARHRGRPGQGFLVEKGNPGYHARVIEDEALLRAGLASGDRRSRVSVAEAENQLPGANSFIDCANVLVSTRSRCAWMALDHAVAGADAALSYARRRVRFKEAPGQLPDRAATGWCTCWPTSPRCSCTACRSPGSPRRPATWPRPWPGWRSCTTPSKVAAC